MQFYAIIRAVSTLRFTVLTKSSSNRLHGGLRQGIQSEYSKACRITTGCTWQHAPFAVSWQHRHCERIVGPPPPRSRWITSAVH